MYFSHLSASWSSGGERKRRCWGALWAVESHGWAAVHMGWCVEEKNFPVVPRAWVWWVGWKNRSWNLELGGIELCSLQFAGSVQHSRGHCMVHESGYCLYHPLLFIVGQQLWLRLSHLLTARVLSILHGLKHVISTAAFWGRYYHYQPIRCIGSRRWAGECGAEISNSTSLVEKPYLSYFGAGQYILL